MAFSDDEKYIYIGLQNSPEIIRFDIETGSVGLQFPLIKALDSNDSYYAEDIAVVPGNPNVIAVALMNPDSLPWHAGIAIYENGVVRPTTLPASMGSNSITFDTEKGLLYGYRNETNSDLAIRKMSLSANGIFIESTASNLLDRPYDQIKYVDGKLYSDFGKIITLTNDTMIFDGIFDVGLAFPVVEPVTDLNQIIFLNTADAAISFQTFDRDSYTLISELKFPNIKGNPYKLIHWGGQGKAAFITKDFYSDYHSRLVIMRNCTSQIKEAPIVEFSGPACSGDTVSLYATGVEGPVFWSDGQTGSVAKLIFSDVLFCSIADEQGCLSPSSSPLLISFYQYPPTPFIYPSDDSLTLYSSGYYGYGMQWFLDGIPIPQAESATLEVSKSGTYSFQVNWGGCLSSSNEVPISLAVTDIRDPSELIDFELFPNPISDRVFLRFFSSELHMAQIMSPEGKSSRGKDYQADLKPMKSHLRM